MDGEGIGIISSGGVETLAFGTVLCKHCQKILRTGKGFDERSGWCRKCDTFICAECVGKPCKPWEQQMELMEMTLRRRLAKLFCVRSYFSNGKAP